MMKFILRSCFVMLLFIVAKVEVVAQTYQWGNVAIGGGGFVSGIITSKKEQGLMYVRTDVGGAYRWDAINSKWLSLLDWCSESQTGYQGVESLVIDPQSPNKVYMLVGTSYFNNGNTAVLRSTDYGNTFSITDVSSQFKAHGNGAGRQNGEKLAVDPNNGNIIFCGTRRNGLFKSTNAGAGFSQVAALGTITTPNDNGISFVVFDSLSVSAGITQNIFVGVSNKTATNLYVSTNAGANFTAVTGAPSTLMPQRAVMTSDRNLIITYADNEGPSNGTTGQVWKYNTQTSVWTNITPSAGTGYPYSGVSVDPTNPQRIIISTINKYLLQYGPANGGAYGDKFYLSINGGTTWRDLVNNNINLDANGCTWITGQSMHWTGSIEFNPFNTNQAWVVSGNGVFVCNDLSASTTTWTFGAKGIEETVPTEIVSITGGPMFSAILDYSGFKHTDVTQYAPRNNPGGGSNNAIAFATLNPNKLARLGNNFYYTTNQGATDWIQTSLVASGGEMAMSADGNTILHCPGGSSATYRSTDNGSNWFTCNGINISNAVPVADPVNPSKFYAFNTATGFMMISTDGGVNFANTGSLASGGSKIVRTAPGYEGHLWVALQGGGLKRSTNSGASFTKLNAVTSCTAVGLGKAASGAAYYTIYIWGNVSGVTGMFRSIDEGITWTRINDAAHQYGGTGNGQFVMGDMNVYGRAYMSTVGRGIAYVESAVALPVSLAALSVYLNNKEQAELKWKTVTEINNSYFDVERSLDGRTFTKFGTVSTKAVNGNSSAALNYTFNDAISGLKGFVYYRLKQVDKDGKFAYSNILGINISNKEVESIQVFPNPASSSNINLKVQLNTAQKVQVRVTNVMGAIVYTGSTVQLFAGSNLINLDKVTHFKSGMYVVELIGEENKNVIGRSKMIVQ